jgi:hypothetical protein
LGVEKIREFSLPLVGGFGLDLRWEGVQGVLILGRLGWLRVRGLWKRGICDIADIGLFLNN